MSIQVYLLLLKSLFAKLAYWFFPQYGMENSLILILDHIDLDGSPFNKTRTATNIWFLKRQEQCLNVISNEEFWSLIQTFSVQVINFNHNCEYYLYIFWINIVNIPSYRPEELHGYHSSFNFKCWLIFSMLFCWLLGFWDVWNVYLCFFLLHASFLYLSQTWVLEQANYTKVMPSFISYNKVLKFLL